MADVHLAMMETEEYVNCEETFVKISHAAMVKNVFKLKSHLILPAALAQLDLSAKMERTVLISMNVTRYNHVTLKFTAITCHLVFNVLLVPMGIVVDTLKVFLWLQSLIKLSSVNNAKTSTNVKRKVLNVVPT